MRVQTGLPMQDWSAIPAAARAAEAQGYDGLVSYEIQHDPFIALALAAGATSRIELGTGIALAFPRSPMIVAGIAHDLQRESEGRFHLGLGTQVKGHNERRFSVPWSAPVPRLREYVESLRAIWRCWELDEPLHYEGRHYRFTLMTPEFSKPATGLRRIPISIAAVGPDMMKLAGSVCDGVRLHGFATPKYLREVALPRISEGLAVQGLDRSQFEIWGGGFVATGADEDEVRRQFEETRYRIAFYGSTRSYHPVLRAHGWEELGLELHAQSKRGDWKRMAASVPDEVVHEFTAVGTHRDLAGALAAHFGGLTDTLTLGFGRDVEAGVVHELLEDVRRIPSAFQDHATDW